ncbi:hypothetical protein O9K51_07198 [Purpureocillium lavendulum]|uniref:Aminoglycoside phosphotransferase domain-containing protein n=1 Tax=Purpureocillium lavendulum TaxID=1247861 RepID=A0AB34FJH2_9HYPO|nr:hypothetical protein O9K51_07198 [Purpureocillium lavendulum]
MREKRKELGRATSSDESEPEQELAPGATVLHALFNRKVVLHPDKTVVKSGKRIPIGEAEALKAAVAAGVPAPALHEAYTTADGENHIRMSYIEGETLHTLWPDMSAESRKDIALQLRDILKIMRSATPPPDYIGACDGSQIRETRVHFAYHAPPCSDEKGFNDYLLSALYEPTPALIRQAFARRMQTHTHHRIVLSHCDLMPRNILVQDGKIKGLIDWEDGGWYPEYWEYVKFFQRFGERDWKEYAEVIFPELSQDELVDMLAISQWQHS